MVNAEEAKIVSDFLRLFNDHGAVMLLIDPQDGSILYANNAAIRFYGFSKERLETMTITDINTLGPGETEKEMQAAANESRNYGIDFDPDVVEAFINAIKI
ncbi:MAG: PAS domain S-box protein [Clostridiaceae bacterium]|jgi:PAS domain S-box-containing protein|nr:PAS domain S-box protein [Clostridiaceae bacterium]